MPVRPHRKTTHMTAAPDAGWSQSNDLTHNGGSSAWPAKKTIEKKKQEKKKTDKKKIRRHQKKTKKKRARANAGETLTSSRSETYLSSGSGKRKETTIWSRPRQESATHQHPGEVRNKGPLTHTAEHGLIHNQLSVKEQPTPKKVTYNRLVTGEHRSCMTSD